MAASSNNELAVDSREMEAMLRRHSDAVFSRLEDWLRKQQSMVDLLMPAAKLGAAVAACAKPNQQGKGKGSEQQKGWDASVPDEEGGVMPMSSAAQVNPGLDLTSMAFSEQNMEVPAEYATTADVHPAAGNDVPFPSTLGEYERTVSSSEPVSELYKSGRAGFRECPEASTMPLSSCLRKVRFEAQPSKNPSKNPSKASSCRSAQGVQQQHADTWKSSTTDGSDDQCEDVPNLQSFESGVTAHSRFTSPYARFAGRSNSYDSYCKAKKMGERITAEKNARKEVTSLHTEGQKCVRRWVHSWGFEIFFTMVIVSNSIFIGVQVEYFAFTRDDGFPEGFFVIQTAYAALFTVELILRLVSDGFRVFCRSSTWAWNLLDAFVVGMSLFELTIAFANQDFDGRSNPGSNLRILRILRITRLVRVVRILRVVRFIRALRTLVHSILYTLKSLMWAMLLLVLIMYIFGIVLTDAVVTHLSNDNSLDVATYAQLDKYFGDLHRSMHTLFRSVSGGLSWSDAAEALLGVDWIWVYVFSAYIVFSVFAVLNVMTGVFCQSAIKGAERDQEMVIQALLAERQKYLESLQNLFQSIDDDGSGMITVDEFEEHFNDEAVQAFFQALELETSDAWTLFRNLDLNGDYSLDAEEFMEGCLQLRGTARNIEVAAVKREGRIVSKKVHYLLETLSRMEEIMHTISGDGQMFNNQDPSSPASSSSPTRGIAE